MPAQTLCVEQARERISNRTGRLGSSSLQPGRDKTSASPPYPGTPLNSIPRLKPNLMDPFDSLPIPSSPAVESLAKYFVNGFSLNLTTVDKQRPWFPYAMQSELVMRATLALAAGFWTASLPSLDKKLQIEGYRQKGEAMRVISNRLNTVASSKRASRDVSVLAAIATLANVEAFQGEFAAADVHLRGLYEMVQTSGGPATIQHDYILCRCINWVDVQVASGLGRLPYFAPFHTLDQVILSPQVIKQATIPPLINLGIEEEYGSAMAACVNTIFTLLRQAICAQASDTVGADGIRILMGTADSCILNFLYGSNPDPDHFSHSQEKLRALVFGAHIFLYVALRDVPPTSELLQILCCRLRTLLSGLDEPAGTGQGALSLWLAFIGIVGSGGVYVNENTHWFREMFKLALRDVTPEGTLTVAGRQDLQATLQSFLWEERHCRPILDELERRHSASPPADFVDVEAFDFGEDDK
ncbi:hypothetical protein ACHAQA_000979 [Verticillium albo-atrum]